MKTLKFKCELLSDVILNQRAASTGPNETLDFIPGSCFLGIVADNYESLEQNIAFDLFHSGNVRFGDAHPANKDSKIRGLKVPASYFYPKGGKISESYINHFVDWKDEDIKDKQLKQVRSGFFAFDEKESKATQIVTDKNFAIKSSYDRERRSSKDKQLYCYESLEKGLIMYFSVDIKDDSEGKLESFINAGLTGEKRIGRSRTSQYGLVLITSYDFDEVPSKTTESNEKYVYADSRLIFIDSFEMPTCRPTAKDLGFDSGEIDWDKSQIRTFQYSPWNYQRQCFDTDRYGIEKGSVFVVDASESPSQSQYVGAYNNEGFGHIIYNPDFLLYVDEKGLNQYTISLDNNVAQKEQPSEKIKHIENLRSHSDSSLLQYLAKQKQSDYEECEIFKIVNSFVSDPKRGQKFKNSTFASQWGSIRAIAMKNSTFEQLEYELFTKKKDVERKDDRGEKRITKEPYAYLTHGVAVEKWKNQGRLDIFKDFFYKELKEKEGNFAQKVLINLASQMAKECKK